MVNYAEAKIYCIRSHQTKDIYVGSTCDTLSRRMCKHRCNYKRYINRISKSYFSSYEILKFGDAYIELIEKFPCEDKMELRKREGYYIRKSNCVNKYIAGRTRKEYKIAYREKNKEYIRAYKKKLDSIKYNCPCGGIYNSSHGARHRKSLLHREYLFNLHNELNHM